MEEPSRRKIFADGLYWDNGAIARLTQKQHREAASTKKVRKQVRPIVRYEMIAAHPYCAHCGLTVDDGVRLDIDHIDGNPSNNHPSNLQVLCFLCNQGKGGRENVA